MTNWKKRRGEPCKKIPIKALLLSTFTLAAAVLHAAAPFNDFVRVQGDQLVEDGKPFRFISWNIPNLHLVEDNLPFTDADATGWRLPDRFEMTDALAAVRQMGGQVARTYVISVARTNDPPGVPRHVLGPGRFNEKAFRALDQVLQVANEQGVRLIIPLVDNWSWWGGRAEYEGFRGQTNNAFWTDRQLIADFKQTVRFILTRTNTRTGVRYADDKAIFCWETGNELECPPAWTRELAAYIKALDPNHLVLDGTRADVLSEDSLNMPEVDIVTTHHYPGKAKVFAQAILENAALAKGRKPYLVGEFGFTNTVQMADAFLAVMETQTAGALVWSLRPRSRDGGFYWHSEPTGGNRYKSFHWPGSPVGDDYDERAFMALMRRQAFAIRRLPVPDLAVPEPPTLLPIGDAGAISWQGSVGSESYDVERAPTKNGPWTMIRFGVDECFTQYRPLFSDASAPKGKWFYRVSAKNAAGRSEPSNVFGPVKVSRVTLVDELADFSNVYACSGKLELETRGCRAALEETHRAVGLAGDTLVYRTATRISDARVSVFFPYELADLTFSLSEDGETFRPAKARRKDFHFAGGDYGYMRRALYELKSAKADDRYVKIAFTGEAQISRVEIQHEAAVE
ncbi:MAG: cellulase family glycosylhydrolase [bacterium]